MADTLLNSSMSMKTHRHIINHEGWDFSLWFVILSPLIGVLVGLLGLFVLVR